MYLSRLPYYSNSAALFAHFVHSPYAMLLESCGKDRFDIIVAKPTELIISDLFSTDPFYLAKDWLTSEKKLDDSNIPVELPFTTGILGYFSYDLGYKLTGLASSTIKDITLPSAVIGYYEWSIITDHLIKATYLISRKSSHRSHLETIKKLLNKPTTFSNDFFALNQKFHSNLDKDQYTTAFNQVQKYLRAGDCYQINFAQRFSTTYQGTPWKAYQQLRASNPMPMAAYINLPEGAILCLSPERFLRARGNKIITQPIKGTSSRFINPAQDHQSAQALLASEKDRAENIMIVDLLRNDISKCCRPRSIKVPNLCTLKSFDNVHHLVSTIIGELEDDQHPLDLLRHCFPGGSITGAPKLRAMEIIDSLEPHSRSLYCGSIAYCDVRGNMDSNITIRTLLCNQQKIHCYGGGGLVIDSQLNKEFNEIQIKIGKLLNLLQKTSQVMKCDIPTK